MKKLSVIIPIYNTKEYLEKCLESVCNQTYRNLEIICIDDGSSDGSEKILDSYAGKDERIIAVHQQNRGESAARNEGIRRITGEYVAFLDCDDWIEPDMYGSLVDALEKHGADMAAGGWCKEFGHETLIARNRKPVPENVFGQKKLLEYVYERDAYQSFAYMWDKVYKTDLLRDNHGEWVLFDETLRLGGDVLYLAGLVLNTEKAVYIDRAFYHYLQRNTSGCHSNDLSRRMDWLRAYETVISMFEDRKISPRMIDMVKRFMAYHASIVARMAYGQGNREILQNCQGIMLDYQDEYEGLNAEYPDRIEGYRNILALA